MTTTHSFTITPHVADEPGALDGFRMSCECGESWSSSIETMAVKHGTDHAAYMARKAEA